MSKLLKLSRLNWSERWILAQTAIMLPLTALSLRLTGLRRSQRILSYFIPHDSAPKTAQSESTLSQAFRINQLVNIAVRHGLYPANCLQRSLMLWWLLRRKGIQSELQLGTRKESGRFEAHAWVEVAGVVLNDNEDVRRRYAAFNRPIILTEVESRWVDTQVPP